MYRGVDPTISHIILYFHSLPVILPLLVHVLLNFTSIFSRGQALVSPARRKGKRGGEILLAGTALQRLNEKVPSIFFVRESPCQAQRIPEAPRAPCLPARLPG